MPEKTGQQTVSFVTSTDGVLPKPFVGTWYQKIKLMRLQPTIAMARKLVIAPALASPWTVEATPEAPEGGKELIEEMMFPARLRLLESAMLGTIDYGWQGFEKVFNTTMKKQVIVTKFKPLLQDITDILIKPRTGQFAGLQNQNMGSTSGSGEVDLPLANSLLFSINVEGTDWYGVADMKNLEATYDEWNNVNDVANRYDKKVAGANWVVHYPIGTSILNGVSTSNDVVADQLLKALEASSTIKVPRYVEALSADLNDQTPDAWKIELITDKGAGVTTFLDRLNYLDKLFVRGLGMPERAVLEGQFGTKAEAGEHGDFAITNIELRHALLVQDINWHVVNQVIRLNFGPQFENTVKLKVTPLSDPVRVFIKELYTTILTNPDGFLDVVANLDLKAISEMLDIPLEETDEGFGDVSREPTSQEEDNNNGSFDAKRGTGILSRRIT